MRAEMLTEEEQERLTLLEKSFADTPGSDALYDNYKEKTGIQENKEKAGRQKKSSPAGRETAAFAAGILLVLTAVILAVLAMQAIGADSVPVPLMTGAAVIFAAAGAGITAAAFLKRTPPPDTLRQENSSEERSRAYAEYLYLEKKELKLEKTHADWADARKPILRFLKELGFTPSKDLHAQLTAIRNAADDCEDAGALLRESEEELKLLEAELGRSGPACQSTRDGTDLQSGQSAAHLRARREHVHEELLHCRSQEADSERKMDELSLERDERDAMLEELKELRGRQETDMDLYRHAVTASMFLQRAKESLTSRYADPIRTGFCKYWEMITGNSAAGVYLDANSNVTIEKGGKQRESADLSTGWRDLTGICLRTALADAMYPPDRGERPPLILDDPFTNLDDGMMEGAMRFLRETGRNYQILYFTCSSSRC